MSRRGRHIVLRYRHRSPCVVLWGGRGGDYQFGGRMDALREDLRIAYQGPVLDRLMVLP